MATIGEVPLGRVLEVLRPSLTSIDLRAVVVEIDGRWGWWGGVCVPSSV